MREAIPLKLLDLAIGRARKQAHDMATIYGQHMLEDLQSELVLRAYKAWDTYDPRNGKLWTNWLNDHFRWGLREVLRVHRSTRRKLQQRFHEEHHCISLQESAEVCMGGGGSGELHDTLYEEIAVAPHSRADDWSERVTRQYALEKMLGCLTQRERYIVEQAHYAQRSFKEIAVDLRLSETRVRQLARKAFTMLRDLAEPLREDLC